MFIIPSFLTNTVIYLITGCAAGYLAGLFGVGGGIIIVPVLSTLLASQGVSPDVIMQVVIGTSMATVAITSIFSARTHHANGNVEWKRVKSLLPIVLAGVAGGAAIASHVSRLALVFCVVAFELFVAASFLRETVFSANRAKEETLRLPPPSSVIAGVSLALGGISSVVGIAGGTLFVPFLNFCGVGMRRAIGTASVLGFPIGLAAATVYIMTGMTSHKSLPEYSLGYVYLPAFFGCVAGSAWTTKHGADIAKRMNIRSLKIAFAVVLLLAAGKMIFSVL